MNLPVVVGYDGSPSASAAVQFGVDEARYRACELHLLHAFTWPLMYPMFEADESPVDQTPRTRMLDFLARMAHDLRTDCPDVVVRWRMMDGSPGGVLTDASDGAGLIVVGHRGLGGFTGLLAGPVGLQAAGHSRCPVVVVRGETPSVDAPVVLGIDGSPAAGAAAEEAFATARRRGVEVRVVRWEPPGASVRMSDDGLGMNGAQDRYDDVKYHAEVVRGDSATTALMTAARDTEAGLIVVGARGVGGFRGLILGSTPRSLIEHAPCPVMVVPAETRGATA